jgi:hypothetical protein
MLVVDRQATSSSPLRQLSCEPLSKKPCPLVGLVHNHMRLRHLAYSQVLSSYPIPIESCVVTSLSETHDRHATGSGGNP